MYRLDIECFGIKYKKSKSSARRMGKYKHKEVKELSEYVKANQKKHKTLHEELKAEKNSKCQNTKGRRSLNGS